MKKLAISAAVIFTSITVITSHNTVFFKGNLKKNEFTLPTAGLTNDIDRTVRFTMDRANLAQADGKVSY